MVEPTESQKNVEHTRRRRDSRSAQPATAQSRRQLRDREQAEADAEAQHRAAAAQAAAGLSRRERREREYDERYSGRPEVAAPAPDAVVAPDPEAAADPVVAPEPIVEVAPEVEAELVVEAVLVEAPEPTPAPEPAPAPVAPPSRRARRARVETPVVEDEKTPVVEEKPEAEPSGAPAVDERMLAVANLETVPLEIELVAQHPMVEIETSEHIAAETVMSAEVDFAEPHPVASAAASTEVELVEPRVAPEIISALATSGADTPVRPVPIASPRIRRSLPVAELLSSSSGTFVSHARSQPIKRRILAGFVMMIAALFVVSLSIPSLGFASTSDFASKQIPTDVTDSQNLSVGQGPALNAVRDDFYAEGAPGSLYSTTNSYVSKESQKLAQELMAAVAAGRLKGSVPDHIPEIQALADGVVKPDCGIDLRILQVMVIAVRTFDTVAVSDINRKCTGQIEGGGTGSSHYTNGGGHAVDFYLMNGASVPGADTNTIKFAELLDPIMPAGSNLGQSECRASAGISLNLQNFKEFPDSCTHMHIDVGSTTGGLNVNLDRDFK
ncbi:hypothetical protein SAMN06295879_3728 [Agreia bicolorata]|uniref:Extensin-like protein C-terminus n=1 Tax=Agreia bicolorata TaxID=110935 RepID=A0A1T4YPG7_9MICO|nr:hypothetical protein [Agreia bicolorata]SKB03468.1 hypothetical protein SAMN06295879_3728 [Agreia bicolorata]